MPVIHLVHGFNVTDGGESTVARLKPYCESSGFSVRIFSYGWVGLMGARFLSPRIVRQLISRVAPDDIGLGHSHGCTLLHRAAWLGAPLKGLVYINPALTSNALPAPQVKFCNVYFNDGDHAVKFAAMLRLLAPWAPLGDPIWGDMGARGYAPGRNDAKYAPSSALGRAMNWIRISSLKWSWLLWTLRIAIGLPLSLLYMLALAPFEVLLTAFHNNVRASSAENRLAISREEDARYVLVGFVIPVVVWAIGVLWLS
jgi:hypothetical protein